MSAPPAQELARRRQALQRRLQDGDVDAAVIQQSRNVLYLTGMAAHAHVIVPASGACIQLVHLDYERASAASGIHDVRQGRGHRSVADALREAGVAKGRLGFEMDSVPAALVDRFRDDFPGAVLVDIGTALLDLRLRKSDHEVAQIRVAAARSDRLFSRLREIASVGASEIDLYGELDTEARRLGADGGMAMGRWNNRHTEHAWLASGPNTSKISGSWLTMTGEGPSLARPYGPSSRRIEDGDLLVYDVGTTADGYHSDQARTYVIGQATPRQRQLHEHLVDMKAAAIAAVRPGADAGAPYEAARAVAAERGFEDIFMTAATHPYPYVGHGVGLEIDEPPLLSPKNAARLWEGMVIAIEPKVLIPGWGGLTNEDTVLVTGSGVEVLTAASSELEIR